MQLQVILVSSKKLVATSAKEYSMYYPNIKLRTAHFDLLAVFLILALPFVEFVYTNRFIFEIVNVFIVAGYAAAAFAITLLINKYPNRYFRSVVLMAIIVLYLDVRADIFSFLGFQTGFIAAGCLITAWILHLHASKVLIAVFGVVFAFSFLSPVFPQVREYPAAHQPNADQTNDLPVYVHIILDGHIGIENLDDDIDKQRNLKQSAKKLFVDNGFRLFGRAYSEYLTTEHSLSAMFNKYSGDNPTKFYTHNKSRNANTLSENKYLRNLFRQGYNIRVYQSTWFNFCDSATDIVEKCLTYNSYGLSSRALAQLNTSEKLGLIFSQLWRNSLVKWGLHSTYAVTEVISKKIGAKLPHWAFEPVQTVGPIAVLPVFDQLIADVANAPNGTMYLAHLLIPHSPYTVDGGCEIRRPLLHGKRAWSFKPLAGGRSNTERSRTEGYEDYIDQVGCSHTKIGELINAMQSTGVFDRSIIIIHGDHGSRIGQFWPNVRHKDKLSKQDYFDGYSTLFAVKAPHIDPGYDSLMLPIERLLRTALGDEATDPENIEDHFVYFSDELNSKILAKVPMPEVPNSTDPC